MNVTDTHAVVVETRDGLVSIDGRLVPMRYRVLDARAVGHLIVVLFDPDQGPRPFGRFQNLVAVSPEGEDVWIADLPTTVIGDAYYRIASVDPLVVYSNQSFECTIDTQTG